MKADYRTWCDEEIRAGIVLADILNEFEDNKLTKKVNTYVHKFHTRMHALNGLNKTERRYFMGLLLQETRKEIKLNFEGNVKSFLTNIISSLYRRKLIIFC